MAEEINNKIYYKQLLTEREQLSPAEMTNINGELKKKLKKKLEGKCSKIGFIKKDSIDIINRTIGKLDSSHFSGNIIFDTTIQAEVCNPTNGDHIKCSVVGKNKMGIMCKVGPLIICLSNIHHTSTADNNEFKSIKVGDNITVEVICSKFELHDANINVIAKLV